MPANMTMEATGLILNVMGRSRDIAATGPKPGSTPIKVPKSTPIKHASRFGGAKLTEKPYRTLLRISIFLKKQNSPGEKHLEEDFK